MGRRRRKKRQVQGVELNLAAMLDMAFQLLAFFILTYRPAPVEGQISLRLPPPQALVNVNAKEKAGDDKKKNDPVIGITTLTISAFAGPNGDLDRLGIGESNIPNLTKLDQQLHDIFSGNSTSFDQVIIQVAPNLRYDQLMRVIDVCTRQKIGNGKPLSKLSFVEMPKLK